ncbi:uncharacterized protein LOC129592541 [Paramacrobiotus metropolitanus]|uniref:uncharacterized protein LOC129592541 n=1 Tax=Paramacrobiotus metropolitanus TaxID=2943436 RepID=UPI0024461C91|nr:uncharacterized protein LOC129592541 [Paramacrobiotus metropolitanus]
MHFIYRITSALLLYACYTSFLTIADDYNYATTGSSGPGGPGCTPATPKRQGKSPWSLDPFLGVYDMIPALRHNIVNFTEQILFTPAFLVDGGERQKFNLTADGDMYVQWVHNGNDSTFTTFDSWLPFVLEEEFQVVFPGNNMLNYSFRMTNESTLNGHFYRTFPDGHSADIHFWLTFNETNFWDEVNVSSPFPLNAYAPFMKIDPKARPCNRGDCTYLDD